MRLGRRWLQLNTSGKEQIITTNNNQIEEKGVKSRFIHFKKRFVPAVSGALMGVFYQQQDSSTMNSALKGIVAGVMMAGISTVLTFLGF